ERPLPRRRGHRHARAAAVRRAALGGEHRHAGGLEEAIRVIMAAAANDPGERGGSRAARWLLAPPSCGDQLPARVPRAAPRWSSLRLPLSLPGSFASFTMITR